MDGSLPAWLMKLWTLAEQAGPFSTVLMVALWYMERRDRLNERNLNALLTDKFNTTTNEAVKAINQLRDLVWSAAQKVHR